jgi:hypothetical protein
MNKNPKTGKHIKNPSPSIATASGITRAPDEYLVEPHPHYHASYRV